MRIKKEKYMINYSHIKFKEKKCVKDEDTEKCLRVFPCFNP